MCRGATYLVVTIVLFGGNAFSQSATDVQKARVIVDRAFAAQSNWEANLEDRLTYAFNFLNQWSGRSIVRDHSVPVISLNTPKRRSYNSLDYRLDPYTRAMHAKLKATYDARPPDFDLLIGFSYQKWGTENQVPGRIESFSRHTTYGPLVVIRDTPATNDACQRRLTTVRQLILAFGGFFVDEPGSIMNPALNQCIPEPLLDSQNVRVLKETRFANIYLGTTGLDPEKREKIHNIYLEGHSKEAFDPIVAGLFIHAIDGLCATEDCTPVEYLTDKDDFSQAVRDQISSSMRDLKSAFSFEREWPVLNRAFGMVFDILQDEQTAITMMFLARDLDPSDDLPYLQVAKMYESINEGNKAIHALNKYLERPHQNDLEARILLARLYWEGHYYPELESECIHILVIDPDNPFAQAGLARAKEYRNQIFAIKN